ncbi:MAG: zinc ribbon domain-containing protein, partial [Kutzneria sp.]|nr:zinc ribbon domain-containing protein [Kutzneria sp.]
LAGLVRCGLCGRWMESHWVHGRPGYRCRHGHTSGDPWRDSAPGSLDLCEDHLITRIAKQLTEPAYQADLDQLAAFLHAGDLVILCTRTRLAVTTRHPCTEHGDSGPVPVRRR